MPMDLGQGTPGQPKCQVWGRLEPRAGRPTYQVGRPGPWPHRLSLDAWQLLTGSQGRFQGVELQSLAESTMAPSYIYMRGGVPFETHHQV